MAVVFFSLFSAVGALFPYMSLHYQSLGLSGTQISMLMAAVPLLLLVSQPIFGPLTDRSGHRGRVLGRLLVVSGISGAAIALGNSFLPLLLTVVVWAFFTGPLVSTADAIALGESARTGVSYPQIRLWGSLGFLLVTTVVGWVYTVIGLRWAFVVYGLLCLVTWRVASRLPADGLSGQRTVWPEVLRLVRRPTLLAFLGVSAVLQLTQAAHFTFFPVHLQSVGGTSGTIGLAFALAALVEVPVWQVLGQVAQRFGALPLLAFSALMYALRWVLMGWAGSAGALVGLQLLQSLSFAIFMPTSVIFMGELAPAELRSSGQALLSLVVGGVATVTGTLLSGMLVDQVGTGGLYLLMSWVALAAAVGFGAMLLVRNLRSGGVHHG